MLALSHEELEVVLDELKHWRQCDLSDLLLGHIIALLIDHSYFLFRGDVSLALYLILALGRKAGPLARVYPRSTCCFGAIFL